MWRTSSLSLVPGPLRLGVVVSVRVPSVCQRLQFNYLLYLKAFNCVQTNDL